MTAGPDGGVERRTGPGRNDASTVRSTGIGSWPGVDVGDAVKIALAECPELPYLPELPARGAPAGLIGRGTALLSGLTVDLQSSRWRLADASGREHRQAKAWLRSDLDLWEEHADGYRGELKLSVAGPWTLAASLERPRAGRVLADPGARRDVAQSLAEGVAELVSELGRRLGADRLVVQLDEPLLPDVMEGRIATASGLDRYRPIEPAEVSAAYSQLCDRLAAAGGTAVPAVHSCARGVPVALLHRAGIAQVYLDLALLDRAGWDEVGQRLEQGLVLGAGALPTGHPGGATRTAAQVADAIAAPLRRIGLRMRETGGGGAGGVLAPGQIVVTPACGLAGFDPRRAVEALRTVRQAADRLLERLAD